MLPTALEFGIQSHSGALIESVDAEKSVEVAELIGSDGEVARAHPHKTMIKGSVKGHDTMTLDVGGDDAQVDGITGGLTIITRLKVSEGNQTFNGWEYDFSNYPFATAA